MQIRPRFYRPPSVSGVVGTLDPAGRQLLLIPRRAAPEPYLPQRLSRGRVGAGMRRRRPATRRWKQRKTGRNGMETGEGGRGTTRLAARQGGERPASAVERDLQVVGFASVNLACGPPVAGWWNLGIVVLKKKLGPYGKTSPYWVLLVLTVLCVLSDRLQQ
jgi:hypothetical protein